MSSNIQSTIGRVSGGQDLTMDEMSGVIGSMMDGCWNDDQIGLFLNALRLKGETVAEIPSHEIPGFSAPAVAGHSAMTRSVRIAGTDRFALVLGSRTHLYEGKGVRRVVQKPNQKRLQILKRTSEQRPNAPPKSSSKAFAAKNYAFWLGQMHMSFIL